jgi:hypothetical protein
MIDDREQRSSLLDELRIGDTIVRVVSVDGSRVTLAVSAPDGTSPFSSVALRVSSDVTDNDSEARFASYLTDEFRERLVDHAHRAKRKATKGGAEGA